MALGFLLVFAIQDIRSRQISKKGIMLFLVVCIISAVAMGTKTFVHHLPGGFLGGLLVLFSHISRGKIGMGDSLVLLGLGFLYGLEHLLFLLCVGCLLIVVIAVCGFVIKRICIRNRSYPFIPYLFVGEVLFVMGR